MRNQVNNLQKVVKPPNIQSAVTGTLPIFSEEFDGEIAPDGRRLFEKLSA